MKKFAILLCMILALGACSNSEQEQESERLRRQEAEVAASNAQQERDRAEQQRHADEIAHPAEPETPPEPEMVEVYKVILSDRNVVTCGDIDETACGYKLTDCNDGLEYRCITNFKYTTLKVEKKSD